MVEFVGIGAGGLMGMFTFMTGVHALNPSGQGIVAMTWSVSSGVMYRK